MRIATPQTELPNSCTDGRWIEAQAGAEAEAEAEAYEVIIDCSSDGFVN